MKSLQLFCSESTVLTFGESAGSCWLWRMMLTAWAFQGNKTGPLQGSQASEMWEVTAAPGLGQIYRRNAHTSTQLISPGDMEPLALCPGGSTVLTELGCSQLRAYLRISVQPCVVWSRHSQNIGFWLGWFFFYLKPKIPGYSSSDFEKNPSNSVNCSQSIRVGMGGPSAFSLYWLATG